MKRLGPPLLALAFLVGIGAEESASTPMESKVGAMASPCFATKDDTPEQAKVAVAPCQKLIDDLAALKTATPSLTSRDLNAVLMIQAMGEARLFGAYATIDVSPSQRACGEVEREWTAASQLDRTKSPAYGDAIDTLKASAIAAVTACRKVFGTPPDGTRLPG